MTSKERARLRGLANGIETVLQIGKDGIGENLIRQADVTLEARELIKGRALESCPNSPREAAEALAAATGSEVIQVIGSKFVLYRKKKSAETEKKASKPHDGPRKANAGLRKPSQANHDGPRKPFKTERDGRRRPFKSDRNGQREPLRANRDGPRKADVGGPRKPLQSGRPGPRKARDGGDRRK